MIFFIIALTLVSWAALAPMLRDHTYVLAAPEPIYLSIPDLTFSPKGFT